jgi:2,3-bisphosphoglycerate-dependent phosphoglycerate mutase
MIIGLAAMRLYFIRHGQSEANVLQVISNRGLKHGLTGQGRAQVSSLAPRLAAISFVKLYSSPLLRAVQTAEMLSAELGLPFEITDALREFDCGVIEGKSDPDSWQTHLQLRQAWFLHKEWEKLIEGGESFLDIRQRFVPFIDDLSQKYGTTRSNLLLIGHGGLFQCMRPLICSNVPFEHVLELPGSNTGIFLVEGDRNGLVCREWDGKILG